MGLDTESVRFLLSAKRRGASFETCATLGRQNYFLSNTETRKLFNEFGVDPEKTPGLIDNGTAGSRFSEPFWKGLGAKELITIDASDFEGATLVHDFNEPIPETLKERFDAVCDVGTLEHIFNLPVALKNCMEMVKVGGRFFAHTTANNFLGHGFYQFSPDLFFRVFSEQNGFRMERMVVVEYGPRRLWHDVSDPEKIRARVKLINLFPLLIFVEAVRVKKVPLFASTPQQSDYSMIWTNHETGQSNEGKILAATPPTAMDRFKRSLLEKAPGLGRFLEGFLMAPWTREYSYRNSQAFRRSNKSE